LLFSSQTSFAADLPAYTPTHKAQKAKTSKPLSRKIAKATEKKAAAKPRIAESIQLSVAPKAFEANADGPKQEDSASLLRKLLVPKKSRGFRPEMSVTISGHIVKTRGSTARLDIAAGPAKHSQVWSAEDEKSGRFTYSFNQSLTPDDALDVVPLSAIAFVTKENKSSIVLVTIDKIEIMLGNARVAAK
jgi:hypothetical protein